MRDLTDKVRAATLPVEPGHYMPAGTQKPDWTDALAVTARKKSWHEYRPPIIWARKTDGRYESLAGAIVTWDELETVTPLYPREETE